MPDMGATYGDAGVHAAVSWSYARGKPDEALLRIRRALKEPRGDWSPADQLDWDALGLLNPPNPEDLV